MQRGRDSCIVRMEWRALRLFISSGSQSGRGISIPSARVFLHTLRPRTGTGLGSLALVTNPIGHRTESHCRPCLSDIQPMTRHASCKIVFWARAIRRKNSIICFVLAAATCIAQLQIKPSITRIVPWSRCRSPEIQKISGLSCSLMEATRMPQKGVICPVQPAV